MPTAHLHDRATFQITGEEAEHFLQNLITTDLDHIQPGALHPGALLTPQGKILFDFLIARTDDGFFIDCRADIAVDFVKRLTLYKLRAKAEISAPEQALAAVTWDDDSTGGKDFRDQRFKSSAVIRRHGANADNADAPAEDWLRFRIAAGVGESGDDFDLGDAFPHDVLFDQNGGVSFKKGCFVGQEVVSRMQHRGTARKRLLMAAADGALPDPGAAITAGGRTIGRLGSVAGNQGLAMVRIDRAAGAMARGDPILTDGHTLELTIPAFADFGFPAATGDKEAD